MDDLIIRIGKLVKEKRQENGYSTQELAEKLSVSSGLVNNIENGKTDTFNISLMDKLSETLNINLVSLMAHKVEHVSDSINISTNVPENLSAHINKFIEEYIRAAIKLNFNNEKLETLLNKVIYEITFISKLED